MRIIDNEHNIIIKKGELFVINVNNGVSKENAVKIKIPIKLELGKDLKLKIKSDSSEAYYNPESNPLWNDYFEELVNEFNEIIPDSFNKITKNSNTWNYLLNAYNMAEQEWNDESNIFENINNVEIYSYRGNNNIYVDLSHKGMHAWLMAMCLSEIIPTKGNNNNQTILYKKAYELGGGRKIPLYGNFSPKGDIMLARLVSASIWAKNRSEYSYNNLDDMRNELGGSVIDEEDLSWTDLGYNYNNKELGYFIDLNSIFPAAPGPYVTDKQRDPKTQPHPSTQGQPSNLFYEVSSSNPNWYDNNYKIDVEIDKEVVDNYNLEAEDNYLKRTIQAKADEADNTTHWFAEKTYYKYDKDKQTELTGKTIYGPRFTFTVGNPENNNGYFHGTFNSEVTGKDLSSFLTDNNNGDVDTPFKTLMNIVAYLGGHGRSSLLDPQIGRRRPGQGTVDRTPRINFQNGNDHLYRYNYLDDASLERLVGSGTKYDENGEAHRYYIDLNGDGYWDTGEHIYGDTSTGTSNLFPELYATTYPSGHSAGVWSTAMFTTMFFPKRYKEIFKAAYEFSISRTILRAHWNSDITYGRLIGTMMAPIINARRNCSKSRNFREIYQQAMEFIGINNNIQPTINPIEIPEISLNDNQILIFIKNDLSETVSFTGYFRLQIDEISHDFCFRNSRFYPENGSAGYYYYATREDTKEKYRCDGYIHGANTEKLDPGQFIAIKFTKLMECHSSKQIDSSNSISDFFGHHFIQSDGINSGAIKLSIAIDRSSDQPRRIDNYPNYYSLRYVDASGNILSSNPEIISKGKYYLSIYTKRTLYNNNWNIVPHSTYSNDDIISPENVEVQYY